MYCHYKVASIDGKLVILNVFQSKGVISMSAIARSDVRGGKSASKID
jgi:hypothetical protein